MPGFRPQANEIATKAQGLGRYKGFLGRYSVEVRSMQRCQNPDAPGS